MTESDIPSGPSEDDSPVGSGTRKPAIDAVTAKGPWILRQGYRLALLIFTLFFLWLGKPLLDGTGIPAWDAFNYYAPEYGLIADNARDGSFLLWNPWIGGGRPDGADPQVGAYSPLSVGVGLLTGGSPWGFTYYSLLLWWLGGAGFLFFARGLGAPAWAALVGAVAFTFSGFQTGHMGHTSVVYCMSLLPWILWRLDRALVSRRLVPAIQAGGLWGLAGLAGYPAITILHGCIAACWALGRLIWRTDKGSSPAIPERQTLLHFVLSLILVCGIGLVVMAPAYIGFFIQFDGYDTRTGELPRIVATDSNALTLFCLSTGSSPLITELLFFNRKTLLDVTNITSVSIYLAAPLLVLGLAIVFISGGRGRERHWNWFLMVMALLALGFALGRDLPFRGWLYDFFSPSRYFRHAAKFRGYYIFFMLVLAMQFIQQWYRESEERFRELWSRVGLIALMGTSMTIATLWAFGSVVERGPDMAMGVGVTVAIWMAPAALAWLAPRYPKKRYTWIPCFLLMVIGLDAWNVMRFSHHLIYFGTETPYRKAWDSVVADYSGDLDRGVFARDHKSRYGNRYNNLNSYPKIPAFESFGSFFSVKSWFQNPALVDAATGDNRIWFSDTVATTDSSPHAVEDFARRTRLLGAPPMVLSESTCEVDSSTVVKEIPHLPSAERIPIELVEYRQESLVFRVSAPSDGWLMITERFSPGWTLTVDGEPQPSPCPAGFFFRGMPISEGNHLVQMNYRPWGHPWLVSTSWGLMAGILILSAVTAGRGARPASP